MTRVAMWATIFVAIACRPGEGDNCVCEGECRGGLVCARGGQVLEPGECIASDTKTDPGRCIHSENLPEGTSSSGGAPDKHDVGGKRDFQPGGPGDESSSGPSSGGSSSSSSSSSSGSSSSGSSSSTGSSSSSGSTSGGSSSSGSSGAT